MDFHAEKPIYQQIVDYSFAQILSGAWVPEGRLPSVRDLAAQMSVNTRTVVKAYDYLQSKGIIAVQRGMGYYLSADAPQMVAKERREDFLHNVAPAFFEQMRLLGLTILDLAEFIEEDDK